MKDRKKDRGFYKPKSYRFSDKNHEYLKKLGKRFENQNEAMTYLKKLEEKNG